MRFGLAVFALLITIPSFPQLSEFESFDFQKADSIADIYNAYDLRDQKALAELLTKDLNTPVEKFRAIFKWVTNNISYDVELYAESVKKKRELRYNKRKFEKWNQKFHKRLLKKLAKKKSTICYGYSTLLESLCAHVGIECTTIEGYGRTIQDRIGYGSLDHAWNAVFLNGKWFLCDPTWASGNVDISLDKFQRNFSRYYFLTDPNLFIADHYPKEASWMLLHDKPTLKEFLNAPIKSTGFIASKINHYKPEDGRLKIKSDSLIEFSFTSNLPFKSIKTATIVVLKKQNKVYMKQDSMTYDLEVDKEGSYYFLHRLNDRGEFRLEIIVNRKLAFIYEATAK